MREVTASAPGKVNLTLRVGAPTPDGYHPLITVFEALHLRETVTVRTSKTPGVRIETTAYLPDGSIDEATTAAMADLDPETHLAVRAAKVIQRLAMAGPWATDAAGIAIRVDKRVPMAGGMAGGSADAAATLVACNELWEVGLAPGQLEAIGRTLGADVPACLVGGIALGAGRGDHMRLLAPGAPEPTGTLGAATDAHPRHPGAATDAPAHHWAIALAHEGLSTPEVFRALDAVGGPNGTWTPLAEPTAADIAALTGTTDDLALVLVNDLTPAALALRPEIAETMATAHDVGALAVLLSGSGPTIAALAQDAEHAEQVAAVLDNCPTAAAAFAVSGPAEGARIDSENRG